MHSNNRSETVPESEQALIEARTELADAHEYHRLILDSAVDYAIIAIDLTGKIVEWNGGAERILLWARDEAIGRPIQMIFTEDDCQAAVVEREIGLALSQGRAADDRWHLRKDGSTFWASGSMMPIVAKGQFVGALKVIRDVTEQHAALLKQRDAEQMAEARFASLTNAMPQLVWTADAHGNERWFNSRWQTLTGLSNPALMRRGWVVMIHDDQRGEVLSLLEQCLLQKRVFEATFSMRDCDGIYRWFLSRAQPIYDEEGKLLQWYGTCTDIDAFQIEYNRQKWVSDGLEAEGRQHQVDMADSSRRLNEQAVALRAAEGKVQQLQKMEAVGQLTGGIAHDFNNMLTTVIASLELLRLRRNRTEQDVLKYSKIALEGAQRAALLTQRLLAFSRQQPLAPEPLDINRLTAGLADMLERTLGDQVGFENVRYAGLWNTYADAAQLENIVVNLAINARDAMPDGGQLTIETANIYLDEHYAGTYQIKPGQYVMLAVTDTGTGIEPELVERIFEPYFTTKGVGKGTGLGLAQVYGFVKQSGGHINVYSEVGIGTTFKLYFPRYYGDTIAKSPIRELEEQHNDYRARSGEMVLVVEDDAMVRALSVEALETLGYSVLEAGNGPDALEVLRANSAVSLLFTDVIMPGMSGRQLSDHAGLLYPGLKVLYTTGYTRNAIVHNGMLDHGVNFLPKPFTVRELARKVRIALDR